jgi:UDP-N-acetylglucosamine 1-carboxyvinyltransferase
MNYMKQKLLIEGGAKLFGSVNIEASKNALLPIIAATILTDGVTVLKSVPHITDIDNLLKILVGLGISVKWSDGNLIIDTREIKYAEINPETAAKIRGSIFVLGAILGRFRVCAVPYPGGCAIGGRPIDIHLSALRDLGAVISESNSLIKCKFGKTNSQTADIYLDFPSVGATENMVLASVLGKRHVKIHNAAMEPEVADLCNFLNSCGAIITGQGTPTITVVGVKNLQGANYTAIPDRINTGSYLIAAAACGGRVTITNTVPEHNANLITKLKKMGCKITIDGTKILIERTGNLKSVGTIHTAPYPGFPTDLQSQFAALSAVSRGKTVIVENLFENRFGYAPELCKIGARICEKSKTLTIHGIREFVSNDTQLFATDLRGGVALTIAGIAAKGRCVINNAEYIYRGMSKIECELAALGANILRIETD